MSNKKRAEIHAHPLAGAGSLPIGRRAVLGAAMLPLAAALPARAQQAWPDRPVRMIIPFAAGGGTDVLGRILAQEMSEFLRQAVVVENRAGASGNLAMEHVAQSRPDGYTLLMGTNGGIAANRHLFSGLMTDPIRDLEPISLTFRSPHVLVVRGNLPAQSVVELITLARGKPGSLNYGSGGIGSMMHLCGALFLYKTQTEIVHVPYRGGGPAMTDLQAGTVDMLFDGFPSALPHIREGRIRALAMCGAERSPSLPDLPTMAEAGVAGYEAGTWQGLFGPRGMPAAIIERIAEAANAVAASASYRERISRAGAEAVATSGRTFDDIVARETETWGAVIRASNISAIQ